MCRQQPQCPAEQEILRLRLSKRIRISRLSLHMHGGVHPQG
eukprot:XP_001703977.1 Hypothetical protein GL50803_36776 [Giardia lamblia ATCC 50803]